TGRPPLLAPADVRALPDPLLTSHGTRKGRARVGGMDDLDTRVRAEPERVARVVGITDQAGGWDHGKSQNRPLQARPLDGLLARHLVAAVFVGRRDRSLDP